MRVELAPVEPSERTPEGRTIVPRVNGAGKWVPVVLIHGWTSRSTHPNTDGTSGTAGSFSHLIDLTANLMGKAEVPRSLVGQLQDIPGAAVFTFDYHPYSGRWVTDPHLGPALGQVVDCLAKASGEKVVLVGHSMGGLVARYASAMPDRTAAISTVITLGTPHSGSVLALLGGVAVDAGSVASRQVAVVRMLLSACGAATSTSMDAAGVCSWLPSIATAFAGEAGKALRAGSAELSALAPFPPGISVHALAGSANFAVPKFGWFTSPWATDTVDMGDLVVTESSALQGTEATTSVACSYQLSPARGTADTLGLLIGVTAKNEVASQPVAAFFGPCFHQSLMRSIELTNEVMGIIHDEIESRGGMDLNADTAQPGERFCGEVPFDGRVNRLYIKGSGMTCATAEAVAVVFVRGFVQPDYHRCDAYQNGLVTCTLEDAPRMDREYAASADAYYLRLVERGGLSVPTT